jgi:hypothetical protein
MARVKQIKRLKVLEASLVDRGACPGATVQLFKRHEGEDMDYTDILKVAHEQPPEMYGAYDKGDVAQALDGLLSEIEPGMTSGAALLKHWSNGNVQALLQLHAVSPPEAEPDEMIAKADHKPPIWREIEKRAAELRDREPLSQGEAVAKVLEADPQLYQTYVEQQAAADGE